MNTRQHNKSRVRRMTTSIAAWSLAGAAALGATLGFINMSDVQDDAPVTSAKNSTSDAAEFSTQSASPQAVPEGQARNSDANPETGSGSNSDLNTGAGVDGAVVSPDATSTDSVTPSADAPEATQAAPERRSGRGQRGGPRGQQDQTQQVQPQTQQGQTQQGQTQQGQTQQGQTTQGMTESGGS